MVPGQDYYHAGSCLFKYRAVESAG